MAAAKVALRRCENYDPDAVTQAVGRQFELLGGVEQFVKRGDRVLLKPNFIAPRAPGRHPAQTHPSVIVAVAALLKDYGAKPFVADSPAWTDAKTCARVLGLTQPLAKLDVPILEMRASRSCSFGPGKPRVKLSTLALDADAIVNLPKFKSHQQLVTTFAIKNMFGCVSGKRKALWHFRAGDDAAQFCILLIDIYRRLAPAVTIVDGIVAMEGQGPIRGTSKPLGWLIAGADAIACETVCCQLVDAQPDQIPVLRTARQIGFGCSALDEIEILGDPLPAEPCRDFQWAIQSPVKFSLYHVCRSALRQLLLLAGAVKPPEPVEYGQSVEV
ncbi:MAG: DUF362 domain-containing protein [Sedimentisphaerales bacterium]|nr:DUF362 domain-containing protein [Sedimentisphaerales bacterium]